MMNGPAFSEDDAMVLAIISQTTVLRGESYGGISQSKLQRRLGSALPLDVPATSVVAPGSPPSQPKQPATGWQPWNEDGAAHAFSPTRLLSGITQQVSTVAGFANTRRNAQVTSAYHEAALSVRVGNEDKGHIVGGDHCVA